MSKLPCPGLKFQKNETGCWEMEPEGGTDVGGVGPREPARDAGRGKTGPSFLTHRLDQGPQCLTSPKITAKSLNTHTVHGDATEKCSLSSRPLKGRTDNQ